ncbi:MAG: DUF6505 family protein [Sulfurifustis sp.]
MFFPRVIRLDDSDERVYETPSRPGEWAVPGAFAFVDVDVATLSGKTREAFRRGFLGTESFGWSTLVQVDEIGIVEYLAVIDRLAEHFVRRYGAPNVEAARDAAQEEAEFAASICNHPRHTLLALERELGEEGIIESFRVVAPPTGADHSRVKIWTATDE